MNRYEHVNQDINLCVFQAYIYLLKYKYYGYSDYLELLELEKSDATYKRYTRVVKILKEAIENLALPYMLIYDHHINKYRLYDVAPFINKENISVEKKYLYIRLYTLLKNKTGFNKPALEKMYNMNKNTIIEMMRKIGTVLFYADTNLMIGYDTATQSYFIKEVDDYSDEYLDYIFGKFDD